MGAQFEPADILACWGAGAGSRAVSAWTSCPLGPSGLRFSPSHVGLVYTDPRPHVGLALVESTSLCRRPCLVRGELVRGVQVQPIRERIADYVESGGRVDVYRLLPIVRPKLHPGLLSVTVAKIIDSRVGYDFAEAVISGLRLWRDVRRWAVPNAEKFCSELVSRILQIVGLMNWSRPSRWNPGGLMRHLVVDAGVYLRAARYDARHPLGPAVKLHVPEAA